MGYASLQDFKQEREEIEQRIDMFALVGEYVRLNRKGKGACPFHQDDKPSFQVYPDGHAYCFGCRWSGYAIKFLMAIRQIDFKTALAIAKEKSGHWGNPRANAVDLRPNTIRHFQGRETTPDPNQINWQNQAWQAWSEAQVTAAGERMTGLVMARFQKERGLDGATVKRFEVGWTGDKSITNIKVGDRSLFIRSHSWIFPVRNEAGQIQMLKWRHTLPEHIKKYGKYGQLAGGQGTLFNLKAAKSREEIVLCTGEFETMVLWQEAGIEAACHTAGEAAAFDIDQLFGSDKPVVYVADNDTAGKKAASDKQAKCNRLRICYPPVPYKDLTDQLLDRGFGEGEIVQLLASSKAKGIAGRRRKTESVELEESHEVEAESVDLATAREILGQEADATYNHKNKARSIILQVAAAPGTGKGHAFNYRATENAQLFNQNTAWFGQRHDQFADQDRDPDWWKQIKGRIPAKDANGEPVDFNSPWAVTAGNCTAEGSALAAKLGEKGWEREFHKYCQDTCPAYKECQKSGYYAQLKKDGKNRYYTFEQMFTTLAKSEKFVVIDEPSYKNFVEIIEISSVELKHMRRFVINAGMQFEMKALLELIRALDETIVLFEEWEAVNKARPALRLAGSTFLKALDESSRRVNHGAGLLEIIDRAENATGVYGEELWELLAERSVEAAEKLPLNFWHLRGAEPGAGGLYDLIKEEARGCLMSGDGSLPLWEDASFVSRLEMIREHPTKEAKIVLYRRRYLPPAIAAKPFVALDATGSPQLLKELLSYYENRARVLGEDGKTHIDHKKPNWSKVTRPVRQVAPKVAMPQCVKVIQDTRRNFSKTALLQSIEKDPKKRYWNLFFGQVTHWLDHYRGKRVLVTACSEIEQYLSKALIEQGYTEPNGHYYALAHYGNLRGSNQFKDYDCNLQAGMYMPEPNSVVGAARAIYGGDGKDLDTSLTRVQRLHNYKDGDGRGLADEVLTFRDERIQELLEIDREDEHLQALHRIRPLEATTPKEIVLLFALPVQGVKVDEIITEDGTQLNPRSVKIMDEVTEAIREFMTRDTNPYCTVHQLIERLGETRKKSVYKYLYQAAEAAGAEVKAVACIQTVTIRGQKREYRRDLIILAPLCSSRKIIHALIIFGELQNLLPKSWRVADYNEVEDVPDLAEPVIQSAEEAPASVRGEASARLHYLKTSLEKAFAQALAEREGQYSAKAAVIRELHLEYVGELNRLVRAHQPRPREKVSA
jgi:hypothetical protein